MPCGTAGFSNLTVKGNGEEKLKEFYLQTADILFKKFGSDFEETGDPNLVSAIPVFIYNREFDFQKHYVGPRYNENWHDVQTETLGLKHAWFPGFEEPAIFRYDLLHAPKIPALKLIDPIPEPGKFDPEKNISFSQESPITVAADQIQILIFPTFEWELPKAIQKDPGQTMFRVTVDGIERFESGPSKKWIPNESIGAKRTPLKDRIRTTQERQKALAKGLQLFEFHHGWMPLDLQALVERPTRFPRGRQLKEWLPLFKELPTDGWGNPFDFNWENGYVLSAGADGEWETDDDLDWYQYD